MKRPLFTIRAFALICVAVTSGYVMWIGNKLNATLSGPDWCRTAMGAGKATSLDGTVKGLDACVGLLTIQLRSVSTNSHIMFGTVSLILVVLIVIVVAGAKLAGKVGADGAEVNIDSEGDHDPPAA